MPEQFLPFAMSRRDASTGGGVRQWSPGEFSRERMHSWIENGYVHVARVGDEIRSAVAVLWDDAAIWGPDDGEAGYVHLLMVARTWAGQGLGDAALRHAEQEIQRRRRNIARLDTVGWNVWLHRWYEARGYQATATVNLQEPVPHEAVLFEKHLH